MVKKKGSGSSTETFSGFGSAARQRDLDCAFEVAERESIQPKARHSRELVVCHAHDLAPGERRIVDAGRFSIGVFNLDGRFYALMNVCPHQGAPLCLGHIHGTYRPSPVHRFDRALDGRVLRCPWHGWEFDVVTGKGLYDRTGRVATFQVDVNSKNEVVIYL